MTYKLYGNNPRLFGANFYRWRFSVGENLSSQFLHCNHPKKQDYVGFTVYSDVSWCILTHSPFFPHLLLGFTLKSKWSPISKSLRSLEHSHQVRWKCHSLDSSRNPVDRCRTKWHEMWHAYSALRSYQKRGWFMGVPYVIQYVMIYIVCLFIPHKQSSKHDRPGVTAQIRKEASSYDNHSGSHGSMISADLLLIPSTFKPTKQTANWLTFFTSRGVRWTKDHPAW